MPWTRPAPHAQRGTYVVPDPPSATARLNPSLPKVDDETTEPGSSTAKSAPQRIASHNRAPATHPPAPERLGATQAAARAAAADESDTLIGEVPVPAAQRADDLVLDDAWIEPAPDLRYLPVADEDMADWQAGDGETLVRTPDWSTLSPAAQRADTAADDAPLSFGAQLAAFAIGVVLALTTTGGALLLAAGLTAISLAR